MHTRKLKISWKWHIFISLQTFVHQIVATQDQRVDRLFIVAFRQEQHRKNKRYEKGRTSSFLLEKHLGCNSAFLRREKNTIILAWFSTCMMNIQFCVITDFCCAMGHHRRPKVRVVIFNKITSITSRARQQLKKICAREAGGDMNMWKRGWYIYRVKENKWSRGLHEYVIKRLIHTRM